MRFNWRSITAASTAVAVAVLVIAFATPFASAKTAESNCDGPGCGPLIYHETVFPEGGAYLTVQHEPHVYLIFWGSNWEKTELGTSVKKKLTQFFTDLPESAYQGILTQYFDHTGRISSKMSFTPYVDTHVTAPSSVSDESVLKEALSAAEEKGWPLNDPNTQLMVVPSPGAQYGSYSQCGWHAHLTTATYSFVTGPDGPNCEGTGKGSETVHIASHEYAEAAVNPLGRTWSGTTGRPGGQNEEISDICDQSYTLPDGLVAAGLWSNHLQECTSADPNPPFVYADSGVAREVTDSSAILEGTVNPESLPTTYYFEYGTTPALGTKVPVQPVNAGEGRANLTVTAQLTGLTPEQTYHYRLIATNATGTVKGSDSQFTPQAWERQESYPLSEAAGYHILDLSCASSTFCRSVGYEETFENKENIARTEVWREGKWTPTPIESLGVSKAKAEGISCVASEWCVVVGTIGEETPWSQTDPDRNSWFAKVAVPLPSGAVRGKLHSVHCTSSSFCIAVGSYQTSSTGPNRLLIEKWNGTEWKAESSVPQPAEAAALQGVYCSSTTACLAVGEKTEGSVVKPVAVSLEAGKWVLGSPKAPASGTFAILEDVACATSTSCVAVGRADDEAAQGFAESLSAGSWSIKSTAGGPLFGVSCNSSTFCIAVGETTSHDAQAEAWNGTQWSAKNPKLLEFDAEKETSRLEGISCLSGPTCMAGGNTQLSSFPPHLLNMWLPKTRPVAVTGEATGVSTWKPTLHGTVTPNGNATTYRFLYGTSKSYGSAAPAEGEASAGSGSSPVEVSQQLPQLEQGVTYHYTLDAYNGERHIRGEDRTFTTPIVPPEATTEGPTGVEVGQPVLHATINPKGRQTSYRFLIGETTAYGSFVPASGTEVAVGNGTTPVAVSQQASGLTPGHTYHYTVEANDGATVKGEDHVFTLPLSTALCGVNQETCSTSNSYQSGRSLSASLKSSTSWTLKDTSGTTLENCASSQLSGALTSAGGPNAAATFELTSATFGSCTSEVAPVSTPWHGYFARTGTGTGTFHVSDLKVTAVMFGVTCGYGGEVDFAFTGGTEAELAASNASLAKTSGGFLCPASTKLSATYKLSAPAPAYLSRPSFADTALCSAAEEPCQEAHRYGAGRSLSAGLTASGLTVSDGNGNGLGTCGTSQLSGALTGAGGIEKTVPFEIATATFGSCSSELTPLSTPWHGYFARAPETGAGIFHLSDVSFTVYVYGVTCGYGGAVDFAFTGGTEAELAASNASLAKTSGGFLCPASVKLSATYKLSAPAPAYVSRP